MAKMNNLKKQAVDNVSYWLGITNKDAQLLIDNSIEINGNPKIHFWFYRSLSLNKNISNKRLTGTVDFGFLQEMMNHYFKKHEVIDGAWNNYERLEESITSFIPPALKTPTGIPQWLEDLYSFDYVDVLSYPCFHDNSPKSRVLGSIMSNYILNNQDKVMDNFRFQLQYFVKTRQYENLTLKALCTKDIKDKNVLINASLSPIGIQIMINRGMQYDLPILRNAVDYVKSNGFVFYDELPLLPIGFDVMLAKNNIIDGVKVSRMWS